jgi:hypothetical protein
MGWKSFLGIGKSGANRLKSIVNKRETLKSNTKVPLLPVPGTTQVNNFVTPNTGNGTARAKVFEQNFIKRIAVNLDKILAGEATLNFDRYMDKLKNAKSEAEAILYYDEITATLLMLILYAIVTYISEDNNDPKLIPIKEQLNAFKKGSVRNITIRNKSLDIAATMLSSGAATAIIMSLAIAGVFSVGATFLIGIASLIVFGTISLGITKQLKYVDVLDKYRSILNNTDVPFTFESLRERIRFWSMTEDQVDLLLGPEKTDGTFFMRFVNYSTGGNPAPNEPFTSEVMEAELSLGKTNLNVQGLNANTKKVYAARNAESNRVLENYRKNRLLESVYANEEQEEDPRSNNTNENRYKGFGSKGGSRTRRRRNKRRSQRR